MTSDALFGLFIIGFVLFLMGQYIYINEREFEKRKKRLEMERKHNENNHRKI
jgi:hypothetical protein